MQRLIWTMSIALLTVGVGALTVVSPAAAQSYQSPIRDPQHVFQRGVCNWVELKRQNVVMQKRDYSCGAAALATISQYFWEDQYTEEDFLRTIVEMLSREELVDRVENGLAISDLRRAAVKRGYVASIGTMEFGALTQSKVPLIVAIRTGDLDHFVVYRGVDGPWVYVADSIRGNVRIPIYKFQQQWIQQMVLAIGKPDEEIPAYSALSIRQDEAAVGETNRQLIRANHLYRKNPR